MDHFITTPKIILPSGTAVAPFLVGQYNCSKSLSDCAVVDPALKPWVRINYHEARQACAEIGGSLITELQWLAIAYDIVMQDINWTGGKVGEGAVYAGLHKGNVDEAQPGTFISADPEERRWHQLSNGERIYDFAGNCFSWVFDDVQGGENGLTEIIKSDSISLVTAPYPSMQKGMGWRPIGGERNWSGYAPIRGGFWNSEDNTGVFNLRRGWPDYRLGHVGFRCAKSIKGA